MTLSLVPVMLCIFVSTSQAFQMIDLTHKFDNSTLRWPAERKFNISMWLSFRPYAYRTDVYASTTHAGTHLDAPNHFALDAWAVDEIPNERLIAPAAVIDVTDKVLLDRDYLLEVSDLEHWEAETNQTLNNTVILMRTGLGRFYPDKLNYTGTPDDDVTKLHFPGFSKESAQWLVDNRTPYAAGVETMSIDNGPSREFWAHRIMSEANMYLLENVANLDKLPLWGATLHVMPMNIAQGSGAPARIFAMLP